MEFTIISVLVFASIIMCLVLLLNLAEKKLLPQGDVSILINDEPDKALSVGTGGTLLGALSGQKVFLPSACGGGGTCAMCKCQVFEGGGDILPTETSHISRPEAKDNWRLACQVKVKEDMKIHVPDEVFSVQKWDCTVKSNTDVATFIREFVIELPEGEKMNFQAGGYIQIDIPEYHGLGFKNFDIDKEMLNVRIATPPPALWNDVPPGKASSYIYSLKAGDPVTISGPYGEFFIKDTDREMVYIGGGAGMAPMRSHLFHLFHTLKTGRKVSFWYGARSLREMFYDDEFKKIADEFPNFTYNVALSEPMPEDNWTGPTGFIHQVAHDNYLSNHEDPTEIEYYMCGPPPMIKAVEDMLDDLGVEKEMIAFDSFG